MRALNAFEWNKYMKKLCAEKESIAWRQTPSRMNVRNSIKIISGFLWLLIHYARDNQRLFSIGMGKKLRLIGCELLRASCEQWICF